MPALVSKTGNTVYPFQVADLVEEDMINLTRAEAIELSQRLAEVTDTKLDTVWVRADVLNDEEESRAAGTRWVTVDTQLPAWCAGDPFSAVSLYRFGYVPQGYGDRLVCNARVLNVPASIPDSEVEDYIRTHPDL